MTVQSDTCMRLEKGGSPESQFENEAVVSRLVGQLIHSYIVNILGFSTGTSINNLLLPVKKTPGMAVYKAFLTCKSPKSR